ncbi:MAG: restriction endonuclease subunit S [Acidimicrobiaceae bacterium]|nr:restriction endonuclease subunit S [Acidimicrobiaceae bacterium]
MAEWKQERLGDHAQIRARIGWRGLSASEYVNSGPFLVAGKHIESGSVDWARCDHLTIDRYRESPEIALRIGDVIVTKDGTIGRTARIDTLPGPATLNGTMMLVRSSPSLDYRYLSHLLTGTAFRSLVDERVSGSSIPHLFQRDLVSLPISVPSLEEQRRIAEILDAMDKAIRSAERSVVKLELVQDSVLADALGTATLSGRCSTVEQEFDITAGIALNAARVPHFNPTGYLRVANVQRSHIDVSDIAMMEASEEEVALRELAVGDLLVVEGHASPGEIGRCAAVPPAAEGLVYQNHLFRLRARSIAPEIAELILNAPRAQTYWRRVCATSSGLHTINSKMLRQMPIQVPSQGDQQMLREVISVGGESVAAGFRQVKKLRLIRAGLAEDLLSGRVRTVAA